MTRRILRRSGNQAFWCLGLGLLASGCTPPSPQAMPASAVAVQDDFNRRVVFTGVPQRIVSLAPAHTETLYALGVGNRVVAADTYSDYPPEVKSKAVLQCWPRPPLEQIVALRPDLVVVLAEERGFIKQMEAAKIPVLKLFPSTVDRALEEIELLGTVTGRKARAAELTAGLRERLQKVRSRVAGTRPRTFVFELDAMDAAKPYVAGGGSLYGDLLRRAGGRNVFDDVKAPAGQVSAEQVVARNPEVIFLGDTRSPVRPQSPEQVRGRPGWNTVEAVKTRRIYPVNSDLLTRGGPRMVEGVETVARLLYPERFQ